MKSIFESLEVVVTLRCTRACPNCIRLCGMGRRTGLNYEDMDLDMHAINRIVSHIRKVGVIMNRRVFDVLYLTGGEPFLHPMLLRMFAAFLPLVGRELGDLLINTNLTLSVPPILAPHVINFLGMEEKHNNHQCCFISPTEPGLEGFPVQEPKTWETCQHYRKNRLTVSRHGYQMCCAAEGYSRLFNAEELYTDYLLFGPEDFPKPDKLCRNCAFGADKLYWEREHGSPISPVFQHEAMLNKKREMKKVF